MNTSAWLTRTANLPIAPHLESLVAGIQRHQVTVLEAPPGSGKTTLLPLALMEAPWLAGRKVLLLQPRRIAAKGVALRMAELLQEPIGGRVGYRIRLESTVSPETLLEVLTEGILTRQLITAPDLPDVGVVIFDEFHERSVNSEVGLALCREVAAVLRPDLRIVVMSATLDARVREALFPDAWHYSFQGTPFPVQIIYRSDEPRIPLWERMARAVREALERHPGDILAFLPGTSEIERTRELLSERVDTTTTEISALYGELPYSEQQRALHPSVRGARKVVLATPIAETSLTIEGVQVVIDAGLHKVPRSDTGGLTALRTERITRDSADQRAGRAGRTAPGVCIRLWSEHEHATLRPAREPEILRTDLAPVLLDLATWGATSYHEFKWITPPSDAAIDAASSTLCALGAVKPGGGITPLGSAIAQLGAHPRLGLLSLYARAYGLESVAADLVTILEERDILGRSAAAGVAIADRLDALERRTPATARLRELRQRWFDRITRLPAHLTPIVRHPTPVAPADAPGFLLAIAFPERVALQRTPDSPRYLLAGGSGAALPPTDPLRKSDLIVVAALQDGGDDARIQLATPLKRSLFETALAHLTARTRSTTFDTTRGTLTTRVYTQVGAITLHTETHHPTDPAELREALLSWLSTPEGFARIPFSSASTELRARVAWVSTGHPTNGGENELPELSDDALRDTLTSWLGPFLPPAPTLRELTPQLVDTALNALLSWQQRQRLDQAAPAAMTLPGGRSRSIEYRPHGGATLAATVQELFGWHTTPRLGVHRTPLTLEILSPARRPLQVTTDLAGFWQRGYPEVRKELRGRYPKHPWPEDPLTAPVLSKGTANRRG